jgi:hypothetical protein
LIEPEPLDLRLQMSARDHVREIDRQASRSVEASATRTVGLNDDKWQAPEVIILTFDSRQISLPVSGTES